MGRAAQHLRFHANRREGIVHLVRHAARDLTHRGQLLACDELPLRAQLVCAIVERDEQVLRSQAAQVRHRAVADPTVARALRDEHAPMPGLPLLAAGQHQPHREAARRQPELLEMPADPRFLCRQPKDVHRRFVQLPDGAGGVDKHHGQGTRVDHGACAIGRCARGGDRFGELDAAGDVRRDGRHIVELVQAEGRRCRRTRLLIPQQPHGADCPL